MLASEVVYNIKNIKAGGKQSDDTSMSDLQFLFIADYWRATLIRQQITQNQSVNEECIQELDTSKAPLLKCLGAHNEVQLSKAIPNVVTTQKDNLFTFVGSSHTSYQKTTFQKRQWNSFSKIAACMPKWYEVGNTIYLINHPSPHKLIIKAVFASPIEVLRFNGTLNPVNPLNFRYPMDDSMLSQMFDVIRKNELASSLAIPQDNLNNGREDVVQQ